MEIIHKYFPGLSEKQREQFSLLYPLYHDWNQKINLISRKDIDALYERHVLHSLGIARYFSFHPGQKILDIGTGGGFPGIPLAIVFPETSFLLTDSITKKIKVVEDVIAKTGLDNCRALPVRAEKLNENFDFIVSRAVTRFDRFVAMFGKKIRKGTVAGTPNGVIYLKGGNFEEEISKFRDRIKIFPLSEQFEEAFFETKKIIYLHWS